MAGIQGCCIDKETLEEVGLCQWVSKQLRSRPDGAGFTCPKENLQHLTAEPVTLKALLPKKFYDQGLATGMVVSERQRLISRERTLCLALTHSSCFPAFIHLKKLKNPGGFLCLFICLFPLVWPKCAKSNFLKIYFYVLIFISTSVARILWMLAHPVTSWGQ